MALSADSSQLQPRGAAALRALWVDFGQHAESHITHATVLLHVLAAFLGLPWLCAEVQTLTKIEFATTSHDANARANMCGKYL